VVRALAARVFDVRVGRGVRVAAAVDLDESKVLDLVMEGSSA
jgi:ribose transport system ATP-binding protein